MSFYPREAMGDTPSDGELMARTCAGDREAFAVIVDRYKDRLVNYLTHLSGNRDRAEEFAQEAFVRLYTRSHQYDEQGRLAPYLFRIATNLVHSDNGRLRRWQKLFLLNPASSQSPDPSPLALLAQRELAEKVREALETLPLAYRSALILRDLEGWSYEEIAAALDCAEGTVKSRIGRGREKLREALAPYWRPQEAHV